MTLCNHVILHTDWIALSSQRASSPPVRKAALAKAPASKPPASRHWNSARLTALCNLLSHLGRRPPTHLPHAYCPPPRSVWRATKTLITETCFVYNTAKAFSSTFYSSVIDTLRNDAKVLAKAIFFGGLLYPPVHRKQRQYMPSRTYDS